MKLCLVCNNPVNERTDREVKFCSIDCFNQYQTKRREKPCKQCGVMFMPPRNHLNQKFCSTNCRDDARRTSVEIPCSNCDKPVIRKRNRADKFSTAFCSRSCLKEYRAKNALSGKDHPQFKERTEYTCNYCGKKFLRLASRVREFVFCDVECRLQWQRESGYISGENSPTWLGGHCDERGPNWNKQARKARKRDDFTCQRCGINQEEINKALDVHHIKPWRDFNGDWQTANHLDNLVSLCNSCHQIVEWESGIRVQ